MSFFIFSVSTFMFVSGICARSFHGLRGSLALAGGIPGRVIWLSVSVNHIARDFQPARGVNLQQRLRTTQPTSSYSGGGGGGAGAAGVTAQTSGGDRWVSSGAWQRDRTWLAPWTVQWKPVFTVAKFRFSQAQAQLAGSKWEIVCTTFKAVLIKLCVQQFCGFLSEMLPCLWPSLKK